MSTATEKVHAKSSDIATKDRIKQSDAARILKCSRQRVLQRIEDGSLKHIVIKDPLGNETRFVSLKQVNDLKTELTKQGKKSA